MATFYVGYRNVLKSRERVDPLTNGNYVWKGAALEGMPDRPAGTFHYNTNAPILAGVPGAQPMADPGHPTKGPESIYKWNGVAGAEALRGGEFNDHVPDFYSYNGLSNSQALKGVQDAEGEAFYPLLVDRISEAPLADPGTTEDGEFNYFDIKEWKGVPSAKAL